VRDAGLPLHQDCKIALQFIEAGVECQQVFEFFDSVFERRFRF
jgi:hypothetical protein